MMLMSIIFIVDKIKIEDRTQHLFVKQRSATMPLSGFHSNNSNDNNKNNNSNFKFLSCRHRCTNLSANLQ